MGDVREGVSPHGTGAVLPDFNLEDLPTSKAPLMHPPPMCVVQCYKGLWPVCNIPLPLSLLSASLPSTLLPPSSPSLPSDPRPHLHCLSLRLPFLGRSKSLQVVICTSHVYVVYVLRARMGVADVWVFSHV